MRKLIFILGLFSVIMINPQTHAIAVQTFTQTIGTAARPTIEGGVINGSITSRASQNFAKPLKLAITPNSLSQTKFDDMWVEHQNIKYLLKQAASQGKLDYVLKKSEELSIPAAVAIIPMVESHYQTNALSEKGAAGAWQIMPILAKEYGLNLKARFHFQDSTNVALQFLIKLHQQFQNWELAIAAYHAGASRIRAALIKNPEAKSLDELSLPTETKIYVSRIRGLSQKLGTF